MGTYSILKTDKHIIFPYNADGSLISIDVMKKEYPGTYQYLHQVDQIVRNGENIEKALDIVDNGILKEYLGIDEKMCSMSRGIWKKMQHRRLKRG